MYADASLHPRQYYILLIDDCTRYTVIWVLIDKKSENFMSIYRPLHASVDSMAYDVERFRCDSGLGEKNNKLF